MPKKKQQEFKDGRPIRKSEFDPERECFMDSNGNYTYNHWVQRSNGIWELVPLCTAKIDVDGVTSDITIILDDMDCDDDRANNRIRKSRDKIFADQLADYAASPIDDKGDKKTDPWDKVAYQRYGQSDLLDQICPEESPKDVRMEKLLQLMDGLREKDLDLIRAHLGEGKQFEQIAAEETARKGKKVSRQAISNRWTRILSVLCQGFGVEMPRRRNDAKAE